MAISFVASAVKNELVPSGTSTITCNKPTGTAENDVLVGYLLGSQAGTGHTGPTGWVQIGATLEAGTLNRFSVWQKAAGASEPTSYAFGLGTDNVAACLHICTYRGVDIITPVQANNGASSTTAEALSTGDITTTSVTWIISASADRDDDGTVDTHTTSDTSDAERTDSGINSGTTFSRQIATYDSNRDIAAGAHSRTLTTSAATTVAHTTFIAALNGQGATGPLAATAPMPTVDFAGDIHAEGPLATTAPMPTTVFEGGLEASGPLTAAAPMPTTVFEGVSAAAGPLVVTAPLAAVAMVAETRPFGHRVVVVEPEGRTTAIARGRR